MDYISHVNAFILLNAIIHHFLSIESVLTFCRRHSYCWMFLIFRIHTVECRNFRYKFSGFCGCWTQVVFSQECATKGKKGEKGHKIKMFVVFPLNLDHIWSRYLSRLCMSFKRYNWHIAPDDLLLYINFLVWCFDFVAWLGSSFLKWGTFWF